MKNFRTAVVVLVAILLVAVTEMGRTAVNRAADYREMTAAKSLHQLTLETRAEPEGRGGVLLFGAALGVAAGICIMATSVAVSHPSARTAPAVGASARHVARTTSRANSATARQLEIVVDKL